MVTEDSENEKTPHGYCIFTAFPNSKSTVNLKLIRNPWRWAAAVAAATLALLIWAVSQAAYYLESPAQPPPAQADIAVALGGDVGYRSLNAARLYASGITPRILITGMGESPDLVRRVIRDWRLQVLLESGVPQNRIEYDIESSNSWEEALNTRRLMESRGWHRVLVVSDPSHMRRLSWIWKKAFVGSGLEFVLVSTSPPNWAPAIWWRDERTGASVILEYIKLVYYLAKY